jgi:hypothetical protein
MIMVVMQGCLDFDKRLISSTKSTLSLRHHAASLVSCLHVLETGREPDAMSLEFIADALLANLLPLVVPVLGSVELPVDVCVKLWMKLPSDAAPFF